MLGEFLYGIAESRHRSAYQAWMASHLRNFDVLAVTDETAVTYAALRVVFSRDQHFDAVPDLERKSW